MEKSMVLLNIPLEWNLWRIYRVKGQEEAGDLNVYRRSGYERHKTFARCLDFMDEDGFNDATSFPSLKPDRDIFGPPECYRKQRGWYHVRRWPHVAHTTEIPGQVAYATAADIPPELIHIVAKHCARLTSNWSQVEIGMLRLVCRRWENHFLEEMFKIVKAASRQRITNLLALQIKRQALGWRAFPILSVRFELKLDQPSSMQSWIEVVMRLGLHKDASHTLCIYGPIAPGRRLTSVYLSSPCRALWNPIPIRELYLDDVHFKKSSDITRLLRELPSLLVIRGEKVTWDASSEESPRVTSFVPCTRPSSHIYYEFCHSQRGLAGVLSCALTPFGWSPIAQSDAEVLSRLAADLDASSSEVSAVQDPMHIEWSCGFYPVSATVDIWLERMHTKPQVSVVKCLAFSPVFDEHMQPILSMPWEAVAVHIANLAMEPEALFVFSSTESATLFGEHIITVPKMASLHNSNRLIYVLEDKDKQSLSVIKEGEDGEWVTLAEGRYEGYDDPENPKARRNVLYEFATRTIDH